MKKLGLGLSMTSGQQTTTKSQNTEGKEECLEREEGREEN